MTDGRAYRFETQAQWQRCLRMRLPAQHRLATERGELLTTLSAAPRGLIAFARDHFAWIGPDGALRRDSSCAGPMLGPKARLVASDPYIWALADQTLVRIDAVTLQVLNRIAQGGAIDIAADGTGGVWLLTDRAILRLNARGDALSTLARSAPADRIAAAGNTLFLLDRASHELVLLRPDGTPRRVALDQVGEGAFTATEVQSGSSIVLLTGDWSGAPGLVALDESGDVVFLGQWESESPLFVALAGRGLCAVFHEASGWAIRLFDHAIDSGGERLLTPVLESDTLAGDWLRAELVAKLPLGATLSIDWAAIGDEALAAIAQDVLDDDSLAHGERWRKLRAILPWSDAPIIYSGQQDVDPLVAEAFAAPLGEASGNFLWLEFTIHRNEAAQTPEIVSLMVQHDSPGLMDYLPAVYRTPTGDGDGTLHRLVQVMEATFLDFDEEIGKLADRVDPDRTAQRRLAWLAQLLGLPFDDALDTAARQRLLHAAPRILSGRGTRAGVRALLTAVLGDRPYRIADRTEQFIPVTLGGGDCGGTRLPAFLAGPSVRAAKLNARLVLSKTRLGGPDRHDAGPVTRAAELLVLVPVTAAEQRRLGAALRQMVEALIPAGIRLDLRWTNSGRAAGDAILDVLGGVPMMALGAGMRPGAARLGGSCDPRLRDEIAAEHRIA